MCLQCGCCYSNTLRGLAIFVEVDDTVVSQSISNEAIEMAIMTADIKTSAGESFSLVTVTETDIAVMFQKTFSIFLTINVLEIDYEKFVEQLIASWKEFKTGELHKKHYKVPLIMFLLRLGVCLLSERRNSKNSLITTRESMYREHVFHFPSRESSSFTHKPCLPLLPRPLYHCLYVHNILYEDFGARSRYLRLG